MRCAFVISFIDPINNCEIPDVFASAELSDVADSEWMRTKLERHFNEFLEWLVADIYIEKQSVEFLTKDNKMGIPPGVYKRIAQLFRKFPCIRWIENRWITIINES